MFRHTLVAAAAMAAVGCSSTVIPPALEDEGVNILLLDHGRHSSLVLPRSDGGGSVRYAYGDWRWYAENRTDLLTGAAALFLPTRAGLGRQEVEGEPDWPALRDELPAVEAAHVLSVDPARVEDLLLELERIFSREPGQSLYNARYRLTFTEHPDAYWLLNQSNAVVADWLEALGCEVRGRSLAADWRVRDPPR